MATVRDPRYWAQKPPLSVGLDPSYQLNQGLVLDYACNEFAGTTTQCQQLVWQPGSNLTLATNNAGALPTWDGAGIKFVSSQDQQADSGVAVPNLPSAGNAAWTMEIWVLMTANPPSLCMVFGFGATTFPNAPSGTTNRGFLAFDGGSPLDVYFWGSNGDWDTGIAWIVDGLPHQYVFTSDGSSTTPNLVLFVDGVQKATGTPGAALTTAATGGLSEVCIGSRHNSGSNNFVGTFIRGRIWNRQLLALEVAASFEANWRSFAPAPGNWLFRGAGSTTTFVYFADSASGSEGAIGLGYGPDAPVGGDAGLEHPAGGESTTGADGALGSSGAGDSGAESDAMLTLVFIGDLGAGGESAWWQATVFLADLASGSDGAMVVPLDGDFAFDAGGGAPFGLGGGGGSGTEGQLWTKQYDQLIIALAGDAPAANDGGLAADLGGDSGAGAENGQVFVTNAEVFTGDVATGIEAYLLDQLGADAPTGTDGAFGALGGADLGGGVELVLAADLAGDAGTVLDDQALASVTNTAIAAADFGAGLEASILSPLAGESAYIVDEDPMFILDGDHGAGAEPGGHGFNSVVTTATLYGADFAIPGESAFETFVGADRGVELDLGVAGVVNFGYHVYANSGSGPIDYSTIIATIVGFTTTTWTSSALSHPGDWKFGVRAFNANGEEQNLDVFTEIILDSSGNDITNRPAPALGLRAFPMAAGAVRVEWTYQAFLVSAARLPTGFHVYSGTGGSPSYGSPVATVSYQSAIAGMFVANLAGLTGGTTYSIGVRAYNATAEEPNTTFVNVTADTAGPAAVVSLTAAAAV